METSLKKSGDNGGVTSGEAARKRGDGGKKRKRKKEGAAEISAGTKEDEVVLVVGEETPGRADYLYFRLGRGRWATAAPSQSEVGVVDTSRGTSSAAQSAEKVGTVEAAGEEKRRESASSSWSEEDSARLRPFFVRTGGQKNSTVPSRSEARDS